MAATYSASGAQGSSVGSTTQDSPSITVPSGNVCYVLVNNSDGSPAAPTGVVWDAGGVNQSLTQVSTTLSYGVYWRASLWRGVGLTAKTSAFRATWGASQGERIVGAWVGTGIDTTTPNGTIGTNSATGSTALSGSATTTAGQLVLAFGAFGHVNNTLTTLNSPSGTERFDVTTLPDYYDTAAVQEQTASGASTTATWTAGNTGDWGIFVVPLNDAAAGTTITPGAGTVTLAGAAPSATKTANQWSTPAAGAVSLTGYAPSVQNGASYTITPGAGSLTITGAAPVLTLTLPAPGSGAILLTGYAPTVLNGASYSVTPGAGSVVLSGAVPSVAATANKWVTPAAGSLVLTGYAPSVQNGQSYTVTPPAGSVTITGAAPTVVRTAHQWVTPGSGAIVLTGAAPSASQAGSWNLTPGAGAIQITGYAPTVIGPRNVGAGRSTGGRRRRVIVRDRVYMVNERDIPALLEAELLDRAPPKTAEVVEGPKPRKRVKKAAQPIKTVEQVQAAVEQIKARIEPDNAWLMQALEAVAYRVLERLQDEEDSIMLLVA